MARRKCKFVVYDTKDDHLPPEDRIVASEPISAAGWAKAQRTASEVALGLNRQHGKGKRETLLFLDCGDKPWEQILQVHCAPEFFKGGACQIVSSTSSPSKHELVGRRRSRSRRRRR